MAVAEMMKSITIEVPIDVVASELKDLFGTPRSIELMRDVLPDFGAKHKIVEMDVPTRMVYEDGGLRATISLSKVGDSTSITTRVTHGPLNKEAAAVSVLAQLCAFESLEQGYKAGFKNRMPD
jgi:hypothetical protein